MAIIIEGISKGPIKGHDAQLLLHGDGIVMEKFNGVYQTLGAEWKELQDKHGRLISADELQEVLRIVLSLVITNELTEKEISLVHRTIGAISDCVNELDTVLEASNE